MIVIIITVLQITVMLRITNSNNRQSNNTFISIIECRLRYYEKCCVVYGVSGII